MKKPKNSIDMPRSRPRTSSATLTSQASTTGPRSRPRGRSMPANRRLASASASRLLTRKPAKKSTSRTLANSPGWIENPANRIQLRAPLTSLNRAGRIDGNHEQHQAEQHRGVGVALQPAVVADDHQDRDEADDRRRRSRPAAAWRRTALAFGATRSSRWISTRPRPFEQRGARQQQRVGVRREPAHRDVRDSDERAEPETVGQDVGRHVLRTGQPDVGVGTERDE